MRFRRFLFLLPLALLFLLPAIAAAAPTVARLAEVAIGTTDLPRFAVVTSRVPTANYGNVTVVAALERSLTDNRADRISEQISALGSVRDAFTIVDEASAPSFVAQAGTTGVRHQPLGKVDLGDGGLQFGLSGERSGFLYIWRTGLVVVVLAIEGPPGSVDQASALALAQYQQSKLDGAPDVTGLDSAVIQAEVVRLQNGLPPPPQTGAAAAGPTAVQGPTTAAIVAGTAAAPAPATASAVTPSDLLSRLLNTQFVAGELSAGFSLPEISVGDTTGLAQGSHLVGTAEG